MGNKDQSRGFFSSFFLPVLMLLIPSGINAQRTDRFTPTDVRNAAIIEQACLCTRSGGVGVGARVCVLMRSNNGCALRESSDYAGATTEQRAFLDRYTCTSVDDRGRFARQSSPTDGSRVCPNDPFSTLVAVARALMPPAPVSPSTGTAPVEETSTEPTFTSLTPVLGVSIPGLVFSPATNESGNVEIPFLAQYIAAIQRYLTGLAAIAAVIMIVYGGFLYLLGSATDDRETGKKMILDAIIGLLLALSAYVILHLINPNLLDLQPLNLSSIDPITLEVTTALGHLDDDNEEGFVCMDMNQCPVIPMITIKDLLLEVAQIDEARAQTYLRKIFNCTGNELRATARGPCNAALQRKLNISIKTLFLTLFETWPANAGKIKIGEIHRRVETQFNGFFPLRVPCGPFLSGFPAPRNTCGRRGHGSGEGMDVWFIPNPATEGSNNCAEVVPGKPFPQFMTELGWVHLCHEDWHFEPRATFPNARMTNTWNGIPCFSNSADAYLTRLRCDTRTPRPNSEPTEEN